jgi:hypothetical protein
LLAKPTLLNINLGSDRFNVQQRAGHPPQRVEVRVVLHALTAPRVVETCRWLARNLPFVKHVALMGLENTGFALANADELWIDPIDYREGLAEGV